MFFNLDALWSSPHVDFVAIDQCPPMADGRPGDDHLDDDPAAGRVSIYDLDYLKANVEGGEYFAWYYASDADRAARVRTPIADGAHGEDWIFRRKAIRDGFGNAHRNRPGGVRSATATSWTPDAKPLWFTESGCPAVDLGANQPNIRGDQYLGIRAPAVLGRGPR
nr:glycoside hydrolase TIM-barrel-like domain-containing protein [Amaricoccus solimangrovi]